MKLYEISNLYNQTFEELSQIEELNKTIIEDSLSGIKEDLDNKCLAVGAFIKNLSAESNAIKEAEESLKKRRQTLDKKTDSLKTYLAFHLKGKLKDAQTTLTPLKGRERVVIYDEEKLPLNCFVITRKVNLSCVKDAISQHRRVFKGELFEGAEIETGPPSVRIG